MEGDGKKTFPLRIRLHPTSICLFFFYCRAAVQQALHDETAEGGHLAREPLHTASRESHLPDFLPRARVTKHTRSVCREQERSPAGTSEPAAEKIKATKGREEERELGARIGGCASHGILPD